MKKIILSVAVTTFLLASCNEEKKETTTTNEQASVVAAPTTEAATEMQTDADSSTPATTATAGAPAAPTEVSVKPQEKFSTQKIVANYLSLKNALTKSNASAAASASKNLYATLQATNTSGLEGNNKKLFTEIADDAKEHTAHIRDNGSDIEHQREHFALLSKDMNDLIKTFGSTATLYQDFCPMYDGGKGAYWISEVKEIKNPYYGNDMLTCGSVKKTY